MTERPSAGPAWGPSNPHPLSRLKTELVWEGKYDEYGNRLFNYAELRAVAHAAHAAGARELHCLAWEFEMELARQKAAVEAETGLTTRLKYIAREIIKGNRTHVQFFEAV